VLIQFEFVLAWENGAGPEATSTNCDVIESGLCVNEQFRTKTDNFKVEKPFHVSQFHNCQTPIPDAHILYSLFEYVNVTECYEAGWRNYIAFGVQVTSGYILRSAKESNLSKIW
jgi:hypothetical protein